MSGTAAAFFGIHAATDTLHKTPAYGEMIGGYFDGHPWSAKRTVFVRVEQPGFRSPVDLFVIQGLGWLGPDFTEGRDLRTGAVKKTNDVLDVLRTVGHHHRCYREKATDRYILDSYRGIEFVDLEGNNSSRNNWVRGVCQYGVMPANGLIYAPPHACGCYMEAKLNGFWALAAERPRRRPRHRLWKEAPRMDRSVATLS